MRVMYTVLGDRAEQRLSESPVAAAADDQQVAVLAVDGSRTSA